MVTTQKNQLFNPGFLFTPSDSFSLVVPFFHNTKRYRRQTDRQTDRWHSVPKARMIVWLAKNMTKLLI